MNDQTPKTPDSCCGGEVKKGLPDVLFWIGVTGVVVAYSAHLVFTLEGWSGAFTHTVFRLMNQMWVGLALGILALGFIGTIPSRLVQGAIGRGGSFTGTLRACLAGLFLDLCNHGILMVAAKLYERGVSYGQVLAFLIASPWNSLSLTLILFSLIGIKWTLLYVFGSAVIAVLTGWVASFLVSRTSLPENPGTIELDDDFSLREEIKKSWSAATFDLPFLGSAILAGLRESRMIIRWLLLGILLAACLTTFVPDDAFSRYFGPTILGLVVTLVGATVIEVCSEGSVPIAAELLEKGNAPGNAFTFLMAGASTDYTELAILRQATGSWKLTLLLPSLTVPQILLWGMVFNGFFS